MGIGQLDGREVVIRKQAPSGNSAGFFCSTVGFRRVKTKILKNLGARPFTVRRSGKSSDH